MTGSRPSSPVARGCRRGVAALAMAALAGTGCAAFRDDPLDVPPGHQVVLGEVAVSGFSESHVTLDIAREDGTFRHELPIDLPRSPFVITLPPGRYLVIRLRLTETGRMVPDQLSHPLQIEFQVGGAAVYVGTIQIDRVVFGHQLRIQVRDDYDRTVPALRARHPGLPASVVRGLARPV